MFTELKKPIIKRQNREYQWRDRIFKKNQREILDFTRGDQ